MSVWLALSIIVASVMLLYPAQTNAQDSTCGAFPAELTPLTLPQLEATTDPSPENASAWVHLLADQSLMGRAAASAESQQVAQLLATYFHELGFEAPLGDDYCQRFKTSVGLDQNVVAHLWADDPSHPADSVVIVGAHYDHVGADASGYYPGANDNASGVAALLEVARIVSREETSVDLVFITFGAEELNPGLWGSKFYVHRPTVSLQRAILMINLDMVGQQMWAERWTEILVEDTIGVVFNDQNGGKLESLIEDVAETTAISMIGTTEEVFRAQRIGMTDSFSFSPYLSTVFFSTAAHPDVHQITDVAEQIDFGQIARAARLVLATISLVSERVPIE